MTNPNKKSKMSQEAELQAVREYLLKCPNVPKQSRALQVALEALDQETKRMERDVKLQRKFATQQQQNSSTVAGVSTSSSNNSNDKTTSESLRENPKNNSTTTSQDDAELMMEWQDITPASQDTVDEEEELVENSDSNLEGSVLGKQLAQASISKMASSKTTVSSPLAAISLALHAALCGDTLGFKCTGVPTDHGGSSTSSTSNGFAAPIRELPSTQLVPSEWDKKEDCIQLRYRKDGVGSTVLKVSLEQDDNGESNMVHVEFAPTSSKEPRELTFPLDSHVNVTSLSKALKKDARIVPTLHYKALPVLLTSMCNTFDLGPVDDSETSEKVPYIDTTIVPPPCETTTAGSSLRIPTTTTTSRKYNVYNPDETPTMQMFQPARAHGDFHSDLLPAAGGPRMELPGAGGNLMGPNHPMFATGGGSNSGFGMRPRFDPIGGPPGGPQDPNGLDPSRRNPQQAARRPSGGTGEPNHDHLRPPNNLNNNMYM